MALVCCPRGRRRLDPHATTIARRAGRGTADREVPDARQRRTGRQSPRRWSFVARGRRRVRGGGALRARRGAACACGLTGCDSGALSFPRPGERAPRAQRCAFACTECQQRMSHSSGTATPLRLRSAQGRVEGSVCLVCGCGCGCRPISSRQSVHNVAAREPRDNLAPSGAGIARSPL